MKRSVCRKHKKNSRPQKRTCVPHGKRPKVSKHLPIHVTIHLIEGVLNLRNKQIMKIFTKALQIARFSCGLRVIHFAIMTTHIHMILEADDNKALSESMQRFQLSIAKKVNQLLNRVGSVWQDRYHMHILKTPTEILNALRYVLSNRAKHLKLKENIFDPFSSMVALNNFLKIFPDKKCDPKIFGLGPAGVAKLKEFVMVLIDQPRGFLLKRILEVT